ncbi:hypothetical protein Bca4012_051609 [Brassica carinata]
MLQDLISGNCWVAMGVINVKAVGYWPAEIFTTLSKHTTMTSYSGMVAQTICEDSVLNHRSKLPWMKHQSTNCQRQVAIDIIMNVPP